MADEDAMELLRRKTCQTGELCRRWVKRAPLYIVRPHVIVYDRGSTQAGKFFLREMLSL